MVKKSKNAGYKSKTLSKPLPKGSKGRIGPKLRTAIDEIVHNALTIREAAQKAGMTEHGLKCALSKPHVVGYKNRVFSERWSSEVEKSAIKLCDLRDNAKSENVQLDAAKTIAATDERFAPNQKVTHGGTMNIRSVGYIIDLRDPDPLNSKQVHDMGNIIENGA